MTSWLCWNRTRSWIIKPRSTMTTSPGINLSRNPQFSVKKRDGCIYMRPPHASAIKVIVPWGLLPISTLIVLWCLYELNVWARASKLLGRSIKTSKQSIITIIFFPNEYWKQRRVVAHKASLSGHKIRGDGLISMAIIQAENVLEIVETEMFLKQCARSLKGIFSRSFMSTITNS